jgi:hypothetical protein
MRPSKAPRILAAKNTTRHIEATVWIVAPYAVAIPRGGSVNTVAFMAVTHRAWFFAYGPAAIADFVAILSAPGIRPGGA